jgi:hypothetical protein
VLLRLNLALVRRHVLLHLPRLGLFLRAAGGMIDRFRFYCRCRRSNFGRRFFGGRRVACVLMAGGTAKVIGQWWEDARAVRTDANLPKIWVMDGSIRASRSGCVTPLGAQPTLPFSRTDSDNVGPFASAGDALTINHIPFDCNSLTTCNSPGYHLLPPFRNIKCFSFVK